MSEITTQRAAKHADAGPAAGTAEPSKPGFPLVRLDRMMESLRHAEYDINGGVGELVDNSVESGAHNVWVGYESEEKTFRNRTLKVVSELAVVDDGEGMSLDVQRRCLALGETHRPLKPTGKGIGRFGVGMTLGGISLARRLDVYTRTNKAGQFTHTFLDLNLVERGEQQEIPYPVAKEPPSKYAKMLDGNSGTIVILTDCDRLQRSEANADKGIPVDEQIGGLANWLGRTYRKFIGSGLNIWFASKKVYLHDPLYTMSPTVFDTSDKTPEPKATVVGREAIDLEVPDSPGQKAAVTVTMTLLPLEWRRHRGAGGGGPARERRIDENEGVSVLRAEREVLYAPVPYIIGARGQARFLEIDRWWGCEISFPPELDAYFHVRYIKRGAEPVPVLREKIRTLIGPVVRTLRKQIQNEFAKTEEEQVREEGAFAAAEQAMAEADKTLPRGKRGASVTEEEARATIDAIADSAAQATNLAPEEQAQQREETKQRVATRPYSIVPVRYPANVFFETKHLLGKVVVQLNVNHPFYKHVFEPLCGNVELLTEDSDTDLGADTPEQRRVRDAFMLLLLSYAKSESMFEGSEEILDNLRTQWGVTLGTVITKVFEGK